jgi:NitT/TauT family transport system permease protein
MTSHRFDRWIALAIFVVIWAILSRIVGEIALPGPIETTQHLGTLLMRPSFWLHARETFAATAQALLIALVGGIVLGTILGAHRFTGQVAEPILVALYSLPKVTFYPLILLIFGLGFSAKVAFGVIHGIVPVTLFTMGAVRGIPRIHLRSAAVMGLSPWLLATRILIPAALPEVLTGVRVGLSLTLLGVLVGELFASQAGLGFMLKRAMTSADSLDILAVTLFLFTVAVLANGLLSRLTPDYAVKVP